MRKICFFTHSMNNSGGVARVLANVANMFSDSGDEVSIIVMDSCGESFFRINTNIKILTLNNGICNSIVGQFIGAIKTVYELRKRIKQMQPDVVFAFWTSRAIIAIIAGYKLGIPIVACEHTAYCRARKDANIIRYIVYRQAAAIVSLTNEDAVRYKKINPNTYVIPNEINDLEIRKHNNSNEKVILSVGRWSREKGYDLLIEAWNIIANKYNGWKLKIVGDKEDLEFVEEVNAKIRNYKIGHTIEVKDATLDIMDEYDKADIFVLSSRWEGLPMVLLEAMSRGVASVSFDCPTGPRDIITNEYNGFLVNANNVKMLSEKIELLIQNNELRKKIGVRANKEICEKYNREIIYAKWNEVLNQVV
ncbi:glycosyltransferase family 4 protein [Selenomonas ruminis]|uniref:Glycosyltransferase family 4 protein n=1 Tax=Selenomonas ruminis TaxID=2593411 RepID=A0A5D6WD97_9FIRM|nr:glycosyltransferase family 4 protein [Selenomonas sp. mPRGC5]TYZ24504.1 glycosyltransferase family 4 protein [Selenomonas sp. mPRGC5]